MTNKKDEDMKNFKKILKSSNNIMRNLKNISNSIEDISEHDLAHIISLLQQIDQKKEELNKFIDVKKQYSSGFESYNSYEEMNQKLAHLEHQFKSVGAEERVDLGIQAARIALGMNNWNKTISILGDLRKDPFWDHLSPKKKAVISKNLGIALTKRFKKQLPA